MKLELVSKLSGKADFIRVFDKHGALKHEIKDVPNILLNYALNNPSIGVYTTAYTMASTAESWDDMPGTWNQTGNTITRATGAGTFPASPYQPGQELRWNTGQRCHIVSRESDTSITVSGPARTITGGTIRRYDVNGSGATSGLTGAIQTSATGVQTARVFDDTAGTVATTVQINFPSAVAAYDVGSINMVSARIKLPAPVHLDIDDQLQLTYTAIETCLARSQDYDLGAESSGVPQKYAVVSIVGNGTYVDVTFGAATHFLAGDKLDLRTVTPKIFAIASASSTSTTLTINTAAAHGLAIGDSVTIAGATLAGYNGVFTVATVVDADTITITDAANPGAMGAAGTIRLTTPATYFDDLGLATIASMQSTSVARITSAITGPPADVAPIGGDPVCHVRIRRIAPGANWGLEMYYPYLHLEANAVALLSVTTTGGPGGVVGVAPTSATQQGSAFTNDWTRATTLTWNAGTGTAKVRVKQFTWQSDYSAYSAGQITLNTPFTKSDSQRFRLTVSKQMLRDLPI